MRTLADAARLRAFMRALGAESDAEGDVFFTGGATAALIGWRDTTIDADLLIVPDTDRMLRLLPKLKESLNLNLELASPAQFLPELRAGASEAGSSHERARSTSSTTTSTRRRCRRSSATLIGTGPT